MNGIASSRAVEARSLVLLDPFLADLGGRYVLTDKGTLSRFLQETCGDLFFNDRQGRLWGVELKAEEKFTGNLFLETWSNRNLRDPASHAERGSNPGWMMKTRADLLFYHFLDVDKLFVLSMLDLKRWAFTKVSEVRGERANRIPEGDLAGRIYDFPERPQSKYSQLNDTWGRCVPIDTLRAEMRTRVREFSVEQLRLDLLQDAA